MALCEKILIAGFSGAGKSSLLRALKPGAPEDWEYFDDLDQLIMKAHGKKHANLAALIEEVGWEKFRLWERQLLEGWLKDEGKGVLALGGGTLSPMLWELFGKQRKIKFLYLEAPFETLWMRMQFDPNEPRPLLKLGQLKLAELLEERKKIFDQITWKLDATKNLTDLSKEFWEQI